MFDYFTGLLKIPNNPPSFLNDSQMWQSVDSGETNTRSYWENGYVLRDNPDGTINAQPKYTTGIPPLTLRKVPTMKTFRSDNESFVSKLFEKYNSEVSYGKYTIKQEITDMDSKLSGTIPKVVLDFDTVAFLDGKQVKKTTTNSIPQSEIEKELSFKMNDMKRELDALGHDDSGDNDTGDDTDNDTDEGDDTNGESSNNTLLYVGGAGLILVLILFK